jgi:hypothetical protein
MLAHSCACNPFVLTCFTKTPGGGRLLGRQQFPPESGRDAGRDGRRRRDPSAPGEAHGAHKSRSAARHAAIRRERENRSAPVPSTPLRAGGMTEGERGGARRLDQRIVRTCCAGALCPYQGQGKPENRSKDRPLHKKERGGHDVSCPYERESSRDDGEEDGIERGDGANRWQLGWRGRDEGRLRG